MSPNLDHTIVHATDNLASARFLADILGVDGPAGPGHFAPVVTANGVALDFMTVGKVHPQHYAFTVTTSEFDAAYEQVRGRGLTIYAWPDRSGEGEMNHRRGQRGFYFDDPDGNFMELIEQPEPEADADPDAEVRELVTAWAAAEATEDVDALDHLLGDDFTGIGPIGFVIDKATWLGRFSTGLHNEAFSLDDVQVHAHGDTAVVIGVQDQRTTYNGNDTSGRFRVSLTAVRDAGRWQLVSCHIGELGAPAGPA